MRRMGIEAMAPQPGTGQRAPGHKVYPYLLRKLAIERSNQVWALDTTYIPMARAHTKAVLRDVIYPKMVRTDPKGVSGLLLDQVDDRLRAADSPQAVNDALRMLINYYRTKSDPLGVWGHKAFTNQLQACLMKLST